MYDRSFKKVYPLVGVYIKITFFLKAHRYTMGFSNTVETWGFDKNNLYIYINFILISDTILGIIKVFVSKIRF